MNIQKEIKKAQQDQIEGKNPYSVNVLVDHFGEGVIAIPRDNYNSREIKPELDLVGPFMGDLHLFNSLSSQE